MKQASLKAAKSLWNSVPIILSTLLAVSFITSIIPETFYTTIFTNNFFLDPLIGSVVGSISAGHPITSYIFGGEMLEKGGSLVAVTAFLVSWVTVGLIQLPAESAALGKKFAIFRNISAFIMAIVVAVITVSILSIF